MVSVYCVPAGTLPLGTLGISWNTCKLLLIIVSLLHPYGLLLHHPCPKLQQYIAFTQQASMHATKKHGKYHSTTIF